MQAHSQSSPAARSPYQVTRPVASSVQAQPAVPSSIGPSTSIAKGLGLAHDAGNIFAALGLYCDLLSAPGVLRPEHQRYAAELRQISFRSSQLIQKLLTQSPDALADATPAPGRPTHASNAADTLRAIEPLLAAVAGPSVTVVCKAPRSLATPDLPAEVLERILVNLVRNAAQALEHAPDPFHQGHIRVTLATIAGHPRLTVEDNGPGMPVTTAAAFLSPSPLPPGAQHGLGHRIIHDLVTTSGGTLSLRVRPGRGTTISIQWPVPATTHPAQPAPASRGKRRLGVVPC